MKKSEMTEHISAVMYDAYVDRQLSKETEDAYWNRQATDLLDMLLGFGMMPPAQETYEVTRLNGESLGQLDDAYGWEQVEAAALAPQASFNNYSEADIVSIEYKSKSDLNVEYKHKMQMAAISSVSFANTKESLALINIGKESEFWSTAFDDVKDAVEREVLLREKVSKLEQLLFLTDPAVSGEHMNDLTLKQIAEYVKAFPTVMTT